MTTTQKKAGGAPLTGITKRFAIAAYCAQADVGRHKLQAIAKFEKFLGRGALLQDLSDRTIGDFLQWIAESTRLRTEQRLLYQKSLLAIAREAAQRGIIPWPQPSWEQIIPWQQECDVKHLGLRRYFEEVFLVERQDEGARFADETLKSYRSAIRAFERCFPKLTKCRQIDARRIEAFRQWLLKNGMNPKSAGNHAFSVAAVVKHARPELLVETRDKLQPAADPERALVTVFEKQYLPAKMQITATGTERLYRLQFNALSRHLGRVATLDDLTDHNVGSLMRELRVRGQAARTVNGCRSKLIAFWGWCAKRRLVNEFPTIEPLAVPLEIPTAWSADQLHALLKACAAMPGTIAEIPSSTWWTALHLVSWDTGERTGALLALRWEMLDERTGNLVVPAECRKGGRKPLLYVLKASTMRVLRSMREPERDLIFPFPFIECRFYARYKCLLKLAGLPYVPRKSSLQKMRRSFATHIEAAGGNATDALSHSQRSITENSYLDPRLIERTAPNELLFALGTK